MRERRDIRARAFDNDRNARNGSESTDGGWGKL